MVVVVAVVVVTTIVVGVGAIVVVVVDMLANWTKREQIAFLAGLDPWPCPSPVFGDISSANIFNEISSTLVD